MTTNNRKGLSRGPWKKKRVPSLNHPVTGIPATETDAHGKSPPPLKRTPLKPVSDKRKKMLAVYEAEKKRRGPDPHICALCGRNVVISQQYTNGSYHHPRGRRTFAALMDFIPVHNHCHDWIHANANEAMALGLLHPEYRKA